MHIMKKIREYWNPSHLEEAAAKANRKSNNFINYFWHFKLAFAEFIFLALLCVGSLIHAFLPWALDFKLLYWRVNRLKVLKRELSEDPILKGIHFDDE